MAEPRIVTATLDPASSAQLSALRAAHYPPGRTVLPAHLTLLHAVPADAAGRLAERAAQLCSERTPFCVALPRLFCLGRGVAVAVDSPELCALRAALVAPLRRRLTAQDAQPFRPHVTLANKLAAEDARALCAQLDADWPGQRAWVQGLCIWRYLAPQWALERSLPLVAAAEFGG